MTWQDPGHFCNGGYLQRCSNDDDQIGEFSIMVDQTLAKLIGQIFTEECDIGLSILSVL